MLRTTVFVRQITNLSDARYCAGMGVELLGFPLTGPAALTPEAVRELSGWLSGIQRVGEFDDSLSAEEINALATACELDYVLLTESDSSIDITALNRPIIRVVTLRHLEDFPIFGEVAYVVLIGLTLDELLDQGLPPILMSAPVPVLLAIGTPTADTVNAALDVLPTLAGLALEGGQELRPGMRDFAGLADALEALEIE